MRSVRIYRRALVHYSFFFLGFWRKFGQADLPELILLPLSFRVLGLFCHDRFLVMGCMRSVRSRMLVVNFSRVAIALSQALDKADPGHSYRHSGVPLLPASKYSMALIRSWQGNGLRNSSRMYDIAPEKYHRTGVSWSRVGYRQTVLIVAVRFFHFLWTCERRFMPCRVMPHWLSSRFDEASEFEGFPP